MCTLCNRGVGGSKNQEQNAYVINGRPHTLWRFGVVDPCGSFLEKKACS